MFLKSDMERMQFMSTNNKNLFVNAQEVKKKPQGILSNIELVG